LRQATSVATAISVPTINVVNRGLIAAFLASATRLAAAGAFDLGGRDGRVDAHGRSWVTLLPTIAASAPRGHRPGGHRLVGARRPARRRGEAPDARQEKTLRSAGRPEGLNPPGVGGGDKQTGLDLNA
jgi:hypothetical protein